MSSGVNLLISSQLNWTACSLSTSTRGRGDTAACNRDTAETDREEEEEEEEGEEEEEK